MEQTENNVCANNDCGSISFDISDHQLIWHRCLECNNKKSIKNFIGTDKVFALLFDDKTLLLWGDLMNTNSDNSQQEVDPQTGEETKPQQENSQIFTTKKACAELDEQGNVTTSGHQYYGGDSTAVEQELHNITDIVSNDWAFAAITQDKRVVTWGYKDFGGDSQSVQEQLTDVFHVASTGFSFAALKNTGQIVTWGDIIYTEEHIGENVTDAEKILSELNSSGGLGGNSGEVSQLLQEQEQEVKQIVSTHMAFAAHKVDISNGNESIVVWGNHFNGGTFHLGQYYLLEGIASVTYEEESLIIVNVNGDVIGVPAP